MAWNGDVLGRLRPFRRSLRRHSQRRPGPVVRPWGARCYSMHAGSRRKSAEDVAQYDGRWCGSGAVETKSVKCLFRLLPATEMSASPWPCKQGWTQGQQESEGRKERKKNSKEQSSCQMNYTCRKLFLATYFRLGESLGLSDCYWTFGSIRTAHRLIIVILLVISLLFSIS